MYCQGIIRLVDFFFYVQKFLQSYMGNEGEFILKSQVNVVQFLKDLNYCCL